ncbi:hypothetical protein D9M70_634600 [compost metagenome]
MVVTSVTGPVVPAPRYWPVNAVTDSLKTVSNRLPKMACISSRTGTSNGVFGPAAAVDDLGVAGPQ